MYLYIYIIIEDVIVSDLIITVWGYPFIVIIFAICRHYSSVRVVLVIMPGLLNKTYTGKYIR